MKYWLVKSEPGAWSWNDHLQAGTAEWDGVRNHQACANMKAMKNGDRAFFYHSVKEKQIVGLSISCENTLDDQHPKSSYQQGYYTRNAKQP